MIFDQYTTLKEILEHCGEPHRMDERVERLARCVKLYPQLAVLIEQAYAPTRSFRSLGLDRMKVKPFKTSNDQRGEAIQWHRFIDEWDRYSDVSEITNTDRRVGQFLDIIEWVTADDVAIILDVMKGNVEFFPRLGKLVWGRVTGKVQPQ